MPDYAQMVARQKALAQFGELAMRSDDLQEVLTEACRLVAEALGVKFAKIMELDVDAQELSVRAGVGWRDGVVGTVCLSMRDPSSETFAIRLAAPVITPDIDKEERFRFPDFLIEHGVKAIVNVPIFTPGGEDAYGLLQVDDQRPRQFDEADTEFLRTYASILGPVIDRLHKVHDLQEALAVNKRLLAELQHRIKNNIGVITGILWMRSRQTASDETRAELQAVAHRIETLRLVHEQLYAAGSVDRLPLRPYLTTLVEALIDLHRLASGRVTLDIHVDEVVLAPEVAAPLGLILNEFATNSLKYAFDDRGGTIVVRVLAIEGGTIAVRFADDGKGLPNVAETSRPGSGTGMKLIDALARQIGCQANWSGGAGTTLVLDLNGC